uniref:Uncharacterized protein n=1 Tax=Cacopsylla melanoneura TaxID=428564 RepID=A0A8D8ZE99_9HEMI
MFILNNGKTRQHDDDIIIKFINVVFDGDENKHMMADHVNKVSIYIPIQSTLSTTAGLSSSNQEKFAQRAKDARNARVSFKVGKLVKEDTQGNMYHVCVCSLDK